MIVATNKATPVSRDSVNRQLQELLTTAGQNDHHGWRMGDKVLCTRNGFYSAPNGPDAGPHYIANGEVGTVHSMSGGTRVVMDFGSATEETAGLPHRLIDVSCATADDVGQSCFALGWAITGHKSQGSQWPVVIALIDDSGAARMVAGREWWYTVLSRSRTLCITIGCKRALYQQCQRVTTARRKTFLVESIRGAVA